MKSFISVLAVALAAGSAVATSNGAAISPGTDADTAQGTIDTLSGSDLVLNFTAGTYVFDKALNFSVPISIRCPGGGCVIECTGPDNVCFDITADGDFDIIANSTVDSDEYQGFNFTDGSGSLCSLGEATAVYIDSKVSSINTAIENGYLVATQKFDFWAEGRYMRNLGFGTCNYTDGSEYNVTGDILGHPSLTFNAYCEAGVKTSLKFSSANSCATDEVVTATYSQFTTKLYYYMEESVSMFNASHALRSPSVREISTRATVITRFETIDNITSVITANYPRAEVEAKVVLIDVASVNGVDQSRVVVETDIPTPYTLQSTGGSVNSSDHSSGVSVTILPYTVSAECTDSSIGNLCVQFIDMTITACDLTGKYQINDLNIMCAAGSGDTCPLLSGQVEPVDINFEIVSNNFCAELEVDLGGLFNISIDLCTSDTCTLIANYSEYNFTLGDNIYQRIHLHTVETGVSISEAAVIKVDRTSDGDCSLVGSWANYMKNYDDGAGPVDLTQQYGAGNVTYSYIDLDSVATVDMACATADRTSNQVTHNYTVRVDYMDGYNDYNTVNLDSVRRRSFVRRDAVDKEVSSQVGIFSGAVGGEADELARTAQGPVSAAAASTEEEDSSMLMMGIAAVLLLLCCCCCCCCAASAVGITVYKRRSSDKASMMDQPSMDAHSGVYLNTNSPQCV